MSAERQTAEQYHRYGVNLSPDEAWQRIGVTVLIGQNTSSVRSGSPSLTPRTSPRFRHTSAWAGSRSGACTRDRQCGSSFAKSA